MKNKIFLWCIFAGISGFIALSYEMLWFRIYLYSQSGSAKSFGELLGFYLLGIAIGSFFARKYCYKPDSEKYDQGLFYLITVLIITSILSYLVIPISANLVMYIDSFFILLTVFFSTVLIGMTFPMLTHYGIKSIDNIGEKISYFYLSNIIGSSLGSFVTGIILMDVFNTEEISLLIFISNLLLILGVIYSLRVSIKIKRTTSILTICLIPTTILLNPLIYNGLYSKLSFKTDYSSDKKFKYVVENKHGVITVTEDGVLYGGGIYDGKYSIDLFNDKNLIRRAFAFGGYHRRPKRVLVIGLGSGSWSQVIVNHPEVEEVICVEINSGYGQLLKEFECVRSLKHNPKFKLIIDDARRWLNRNPNEKFDAIISNTTWNYRLMVSNLLSKEFMEIAKGHLNTGGTFQYNGTFSDRAYKTGVLTFEFAFKYNNNMICSDFPLEFDKELWKRNILDWKIDEKYVIDTNTVEGKNRLEEILLTVDNDTEPKDSLLRRLEGWEIITDNNMGTEWEWNP